MMISTILLNWNRGVLLDQTLRSYADTMTGPHELFVVDNASTDHSRSVIENACKYLPHLNAIFLDENIGGEAFNACFWRVSGELIHLSENDYEYLPGWAEHARISFRNFVDLGQLSLRGIHGDVSSGDTPPVRLRFAQGQILYEMTGNVVTTSILRGDLIREHGIRITNYAQSDPDAFKLPDDGKLSRDVRQAGCWCACSDRHYARNVGHEMAEFERDPDYYRGNYASKSWLGVEGWQRRIADAKKTPKPLRHSTVFPLAEIQPERIWGSGTGIATPLWSMFDTSTAEAEVVDFLYALVRLIKPSKALETGAWLARSAIAIGKALRDNGFGHLLTIEANEQVIDYAIRNVEEANLTQFVSVQLANSLTFEWRETYDFVFFDTGAPDEFRKIHRNLKPAAVIVFHGAAGQLFSCRTFWKNLAITGLVEGIDLNTPRGLFIAKSTIPADGRLRRLPDGFDPAAYLTAHSDVASSGVDAAEHYQCWGWREGRSLAPSGPTGMEAWVKSPAR